MLPDDRERSQKLLTVAGEPLSQNLSQIQPNFSQFRKDPFELLP